MTERRFIETDFYRGPVPFDPAWSPDGTERFVISWLTRHDDRQAANDAKQHWANGGAV